MCVCLCRCTNAESYIIARLPDLIGSDPATLNKSIALADNYFYNQGGGVKDILKSVAGVNLDDVFATVNSTRDQAVQVATPQNNMLAMRTLLTMSCCNLESSRRWPS